MEPEASGEIEGSARIDRCIFQQHFYTLLRDEQAGNLTPPLNSIPLHMSNHSLACSG
jgi:hypothetical protein